MQNNISLNQAMTYRYGYMARRRAKQEAIIAGILLAVAIATFILSAALFPAAIA